MRVNARRLGGALALTLTLLSGGVLAGCTSSLQTQTSQSPGASADPDNVPADDTDYSEDAGDNMPEYEYEDEPAPPPSVVGLLCNLNQEFFRALRTSSNGTPVADDALRSNLVGLSDLVGEVQSLRPHYPEAEPSIDAAGAIFDNWDAALLALDNGDATAARSAMAAAESTIDKLPSVDDVVCEP